MDINDRQNYNDEENNRFRSNRNERGAFNAPEPSSLNIGRAPISGSQRQYREPQYQSGAMPQPQPQRYNAPPQYNLNSGYEQPQQAGQYTPQMNQNYGGAPQRPQPQMAENFDYDYNSMPNQGDMQEEPQRKKRGFFSAFKNKKDDESMASMSNVVILSPRTFSEVQGIIDSLRNRQAIIVDMNRIGEKNYQRILDYLNGAVYALGGGQQRFSDNMFLFTPEGVSIQGTVDLKKRYK